MTSRRATFAIYSRTKAHRVGIGDGIESGFIHAAMTAVQNRLPSDPMSTKRFDNMPDGRVATVMVGGHAL
jgi:hypothetical protein